jgi:hypothetical protein
MRATGNGNIDRAGERLANTWASGSRRQPCRTAVRTCAALCLFAAALLAGAGEAGADTRPYVVFVRGFQPPPGGDSFAPLGMQPVRNYLAGFGAEVHSVTWNCFRDGAAQNTCGPLNDAQFLQDIGNAVNAVPLERPVVLIGHSFGGDSLLKAVSGAQGITNKINRPITALIVLDPVGFAGRRLTVDGFYNAVPSRVGIFFNRWQRNEAPPFNFGDSGFTSCSAGVCSQAEQSVQKSCSGATLTDVIQPPTPPCPPGLPPWLCPGPPPPITIDRRSTHGSLVDDAFVNRQIIEQLHTMLSPRSASVTFFNRKLGRFMVAEGGGGGAVLVNRTAAGPWETFSAVDLNGGVWMTADPVNLQASNGRFVSAQPDGSVVADRTQAFEWENFKVLKAAGGEMSSGSIVYLEDNFGRYLASTQDQRLVGVSPADCLNAAYGCAFVIDIRSTGNLPPAPVCQ